MLGMEAIIVSLKVTTAAAKPVSASVEVFVAAEESATANPEIFTAVAQPIIESFDVFLLLLELSQPARVSRQGLS